VDQALFHTHAKFGDSGCRSGEENQDTVSTGDDFTVNKQTNKQTVNSFKFQLLMRKETNVSLIELLHTLMHFITKN